MRCWQWRSSTPALAHMDKKRRPTSADPGSATARRSEWTKARRIVVKIGSSLLVDRGSGELKSAWLESLADDVAELVAGGKEVIVVSSGAIALGRHVLAFSKGSSLALEQSQAAAAVGQISLASAYQAVFKARGLTAAQILLTLGRYRGAAALSQCPPDHRHAARRSTPFRSSTRTTRWRPPKSATATTTACRRASPA